MVASSTNLLIYFNTLFHSYYNYTDKSSPTAYGKAYGEFYFA